MQKNDNKLFHKYALILQKLGIFFLDTLFPISCLSCGKENDWLCPACEAQITLRSDQTCPICEKTTTPDGRTCFACRKKAFLDGMVVASSYQQAIISHAVHLFKYNFIPELHLPLGKILARAILQTELALPEMIIPIPLHSRRLRWRGFNQSTLLARYLSENLLANCEIPLEENILRRIRWTKPQMKIKDFHQRRKNLSSAFSVSSPDMIKNKTILLVDDVATTGSTIFECARVLKKAGAKEVFAVVIARQEISSK